jgi:hypothetical protein
MGQEAVPAAVPRHPLRWRPVLSTLAAMGAAVSLQPVGGVVPPGGEASCEVRVRNSGAVVDKFVLDVVGDAAGWARVDPPSLNLLPGEEGSATVQFSPPRKSTVPEGPVAFAVRVMSTEDVEGSVVEESVVDVGGFTDVAGEVVPRTSTGRRTGRPRLFLDNLGNRPELVSVEAYDPDLLLDVRVDRPNLTLEPGATTFVRLLVKPRKTFVNGPNRSVPFQVDVTPEESAPFSLPAAMVQQSLLPSWFFKALGVLALAAVAAVALWFLLLKPTVESTAQDVAASENEKLAHAITDASTRAAAAQESAAAADEKATDAQQKADDAADGPASKPSQGSGSDSGNGNVGTLNPADAVDGRVTLDAPPAGTDRQSFTPPPKRTLWISDLVLQNPEGADGVVRIQRDNEVLLVFGLQNFRDLDYHFIQPASFTNEKPFVVTVRCTNQPAAGRCTPSVYFTGQSLKPPKKPTTASSTVGAG